MCTVKVARGLNCRQCDEKQNKNAIPKKATGQLLGKF